ncbi:MAG: class IV adenylate cyclase [Patescibacteria group bacterium]|jgi:adenylate cyclase class 2
MSELEVKILEVNAIKITQELERLGAICAFDGTMDVVFFDFPDGRLDKQKIALRLRSKGMSAELTMKKTTNQTRIKVAEETEVTVSNFEVMRQILKASGLRETKSYQKHRASWKLEGVSFELDSISGIPTFLEIEAQSEELIFVWVRKLGFSEEDAKPWRRQDLLAHYAKH